MNLLIITTCGHNLRKGRQNRILSAMEWAPCGEIWIISIRHHGYCITLMIPNWKLRNHRLGLGQLILTTERHVDAGCTDRTIEHLNKSLLRSHINIRQSLKPCSLHIILTEGLTNLFIGLSLKEIRLLIWHLNFDRSLLMGSIGINEGTRHIYNFLASPGENHTWLFCYNSNLGCL